MPRRPSFSSSHLASLTVDPECDDVAGLGLGERFAQVRGGLDLPAAGFEDAVAGLDAGLGGGQAVDDALDGDAALLGVGHGDADHHLGGLLHRGLIRVPVVARAGPEGLDAEARRDGDEVLAVAGGGRPHVEGLDDVAVLIEDLVALAALADAVRGHALAVHLGADLVVLDAERVGVHTVALAEHHPGGDGRPLRVERLVEVVLGLREAHGSARRQRDRRGEACHASNCRAVVHRVDSLGDRGPRLHA
jgi:hypothetical protein